MSPLIASQVKIVQNVRLIS